jgi:uncharacterized protein YndB with AHSA1/START domain
VTGIAEVVTHVAGTPPDVFRYFTDPERYVRWMGGEAVLDPVPGGAYAVRMDDGFAAAGTFSAVEPPHLVAFTWGFADREAAEHTKRTDPGNAARPSDANPLPAGSSQVSVTLVGADGGTRLTLRHELLPTAELVKAHQVAWETYLPRLAIVVAGGDPGPDPHAAT